jgi:hypothetical protein
MWIPRFFGFIRKNELLRQVMSRKNTSKNSKKRRRGRPRKDAGLDDYAGVGAPPYDDVLGIGRWLQRVVAITAHQARSGRGDPDKRSAIRTSCKAAARLLPSAMTARALGLVEMADASTSVEPDGPPPEDPLQINDWFLMNLVADVYRQITGQAEDKVSTEWRSASMAAVKVWPPDLMIEAGRVLREELAKDQSSDGPEPVRFEDVIVEDASASRPRSLNLKGETHASK